MKLIKTDLYLLLIDEEAEISKTGTLIYENDTNFLNITGVDYEPQGLDSKIIAYYPLTKEAKDLDLPLLPNPFEKDTIMYNLLDKDIPSVMSNYGKSDGTMETSIDYNKGHRDSWIKGYKAAQSKGQYSLEDIKKAIEMAREDDKTDSGFYIYSEKEIIQSIYTQQLPKEFIPEYDKINDFGEPYTCDDMDFGVEIEYKLKTIINSEGKEELAGTYKY